MSLADVADLPEAGPRPGAQRAGAALAVRTEPIEDPGALLALLPDAPVAVWVRDGEGMVGWGEAARWEGSGSTRFRDARAWLADLSARSTIDDAVSRPGTGLIAFGAFGFGDEAPDERDGTLRASVLIVPEVVVGHRDGAWWVSTAAPAGAEAPPAAIGAARDVAPVRALEPVAWESGACSAQEWGEVVARAIEAIGAGRAEKVVLARDVVARAGAPIDPRAVLTALAARYPSCWTFGVDGLIGATPEMLVRVADGVAESRVLAGTLRRDRGGASSAAASEAIDQEQSRQLMASGKDRREHEFSVRSVVAALGPHCRSLAVPQEPFVLLLPNVLHLASDVRGDVDDSSSSLALAEALHPTAAVCGTPREAAQQLIAELEPMARGRYAGPVGWQSANGDGEWGIALRCAETDVADSRRMRLFAGAGIVVDSAPISEIAETDAKFAPMREALGAVE